ncbi:MAG: hypothetical protein EBT79_12730 [Actinobacteria bacterium]|nr:hypothetical protein [Actinomycetota bacterium]NBR68110.1 hypothetical protein [Actinomycetota bacterium]
MNRPSASRVASRRLLVDVVMVFLDALRRNLPHTRRAFDAFIPHTVEFASSGALELLTWRINLALHTPATVSKIVVRLLNAAKPDGALRGIVGKVVDGERIDRQDVDALVDVLEGATVDVLNDIADVRSAAEAMRIPVDDAIRMTLGPKVNAARSAVQGALGN